MLESGPRSDRQSWLLESDTLASVARVAVWSFAIVVAVNQIGIATTLINTLLIGVVGAVALASGLAFGLGGREVAGETVRGWQRQARENAPKVAKAAETMKRQAGPGGRLSVTSARRSTLCCRRLHESRSQHRRTGITTPVFVVPARAENGVRLSSLDVVLPR